jgi:hypothetical protein
MLINQQIFVIFSTAFMPAETISAELHHFQHHHYGDHSTMALFSVRYLNMLGKEVLEKY